MSKQLFLILFAFFPALGGISWLLTGIIPATYLLSPLDATNSQNNTQQLDATVSSNSHVGGIEATVWFSQTIDDTGDVGYYTSMSLDSNNNPHISYYDATNFNLKYTYWTGSEWISQTVDSAGDVGQYTSLALDSNNIPHIGYYDLTNGTLKYAYWSGSEWLSQTVDITGQMSRYLSLAIDSSNRPHISYSDTINEDLKYAYWSGSGWISQTVDSTGHIGWHNSLALDSNEEPHISYYDGTNYNLKYAYWTGIEWISQTVDSAGTVGAYTSLELDSNDNPHISYTELEGLLFDNLQYAYWSGSTWILQEVEPIGDSGSYASLSLDNNDIPHISYHDKGNDSLKYAYWSGSEWISQTVDSTGDVGRFTSLVLDTNNVPHISYLDRDNINLKYAYALHTLQISKYGPTNVIANKPITYTIEVNNNLSITLTNLVITDVIPTGANYVSGGTLVGNIVSWTIPSLATGETINHQFIVTAAETITNSSYSVTSAEGYTATGSIIVVTIVNDPITGLQATNNSPTRLGEPTTLTATLVSGGNVIYLWNFGDGYTATGQVVSHTYPAVTNYTATVIGKNDVSTATATTTIAILDIPITGLTVTNDSLTVLGDATTFTATVIAGSNVSYLWNFGDGKTGNGNIVSYIYPAPGKYSVVVTASNSISTMMVTNTVTIAEPIFTIHLPILIKP